MELYTHHKKRFKLPAKKVFTIITIILVTLIGISSCAASNNAEKAPQVIEDYLEGLVSKNVNQMITNSCAAWESEAKLEFDSFAAVETTLENPNCQVSKQEEEFIVVSCSGVIIAGYGAEDLIIELSERDYQLVNEGGQWRMCGYQ